MKLIKRTALFLLVVAFSSGCVEKMHYDGEKSNQEATKMVSTEEFVVPVKSGYTTNVFNNGVLVASTSKPMTILVPKKSLQTVRSGASSITVSYQSGIVTESSSVLWQTLLFEDSRKGDCDYNDLVFNARYKTTDNKLRVSINPIALGSTKKIKLSFRWVQGANFGVVDVTNDCRQDLFDNKAGFINTSSYDIHYGVFKKEIDIPINGVQEPVYIWWFITVDDNDMIFAVNTNGQQSFDEKGMPYGFAISDAGNGLGVIQKAGMRFSSAEDIWESSIIPTDHSSWSFMPKQPTVPAGTPTMDDYQAWQGRKINHIKSGSTFSEALQFVSGFELYVEGTLNYKSSGSWGSGPAVIYVMPGGVLNLDGMVDGVNIVNYGTVNATKDFTIQNATLKSANDLNFEGKKLTMGKEAKVYTPQELRVASLLLNSVSSYAYVGSLDVLENVELTTQSRLFVNGEMTVGTRMELNSNTQCYVGCKLAVGEILYMTNNIVLSVNGSIKTPEIECSSNVSVNINNGGIIDTKEMSIWNTTTSKFRIIGTGFGVIKANTLTLSGGLDLSNTFGGNMYLDFTQLKENKKVIDLDNKRLTLPPASVRINSDDAQLPETGCSPGYKVEGGNNGNGSNVLSWFAYPLESVNINSCYKFSSWLDGNFDFTPKNGAKIFDINRKDPKEGEQKSIFEMK